MPYSKEYLDKVDKEKLLDAIHGAVSFTYIDTEEARLRARVALKEAAGWPLTDGEQARITELYAERMKELNAKASPDS